MDPVLTDVAYRKQHITRELVFHGQIPLMNLGGLIVRVPRIKLGPCKWISGSSQQRQTLIGCRARQNELGPGGVNTRELRREGRVQVFPVVFSAPFEKGRNSIGAADNRVFTQETRRIGKAQTRLPVSPIGVIEGATAAHNAIRTAKNGSAIAHNALGG